MKAIEENYSLPRGFKSSAQLAQENRQKAEKAKERQEAARRTKAEEEAALVQDNVEWVKDQTRIQEYLQSYARTQQWKMSDDQVNEDTWTFSMELDKDELLRATTEDSRNRRVEWTGGTVRVHVNTALLPDGYSRTIVRASFRGYGRSADQFATQKEHWQLDSNNSFENSVVSALRSHFTATSSAAIPRPRISSEIPLFASRWNTSEWAPGFSD